MSQEDNKMAATNIDSILASRYPTQNTSNSGNYGDYGQAPSGMTPNEFSRINLGQTTSGQQGQAFNPAFSGYTNMLNTAQSGVSNLANQRYNLSNPGNYGGGNLSQQTAGRFNLSNNMDALVKQQYGQAQQQNVMQARNIANQVAQASGGNQALASALGTRAMQQAMLANNSLRPQFMQAQADRDVQNYTNNLQSMEANNLARARQEEANRQAYTSNLQGAQLMNQSEASRLGAYTQAASPLVNIFGMLGQQLPAFGDQTSATNTFNLGQRETGGGGK